ncbi:peptide ABC transporter permease [Enterovirga rhinocerotis]|uniref:O-antigen ligase n=1 Tax=Enterovirga rhinocerotis TaxID=1339210 RepID=A0A4R7BWU2_9HYPH|nr:peptide ABC transporter permease [Enterovirga rhinocerotis]TDR89973.1 hypothetical protein EV668_2810 [Enterovirga rhinocerotis]
MAQTSRSLLDPTRDTASVLRRVGILVLLVALPPAAAMARTGAVVAFAIGVVLIAIAAALDMPPNRLRQTLLRLTGSTAVVAAGVAAVWTALSLAWTPASAWRAAASITVILALGLVGFAALPERMRSANLYPAPIGVGALALASAGLLLGLWGDEGTEGARQIERALAVLVLLAWPAIAWLRSRGRDVEAVALGLSVAVIAAFGPTAVAVMAFAFGAVAYLSAQLFRRGAAALGLLLGVLLLVAPALLAVAHLDAVSDQAWSGAMARWREALLGEPARLLTGHGFGSLRARPDLPDVLGSPVLALWYELGIVGVAALAVAVAAGLSIASRHFGPLLPGLAAAVATAFALGAAGIGGGALWWPVSLVTTCLLFIAMQRGQFRSRRPRAMMGFGRSQA